MHRSVAVAAAVVAVTGEAVAIAVSSGAERRWNEAAVGAVVVAWAVVGLLIVWHRPDHPIGRVALASAMAWGPAQAMVDLSANSLRSDPSDRLAALGNVLGAAVDGLAWLVLVLWVPVVFPDGFRPVTRLRRTARTFVLVTLVSFSVVSLFSPTLSRIEFQHVDNPIGLPHALAGPAEALAGLNLLLGVASLALGVACVVQQYRRGSALTRQQTVVFALAFLPPLAAFAASAADAGGPWLFGVCTLPLPVAIGVSVLQRKLYDVPLVLNRSLTYGGLWVLIAILYAVVVGGVGALVRDEGAAWLPWVAAGVVAVSFAPLRDALQRAANRVTYGQWASPDEVRARTSERLADAADLTVVLDELVEDLAVGLGLGYVEITDRTGARLASSGTPTEVCDDLPLTAYGETVGRLRWTARPLREVDRALLVDLAERLGGLVQASGLVASVRQAQERLVLAREEERRRLRRELHDGLGPALAGLSLQVDTVRNTIGNGQDVEPTLLGLRAGIQDTVLDVRRIVEGLRPPALDDLGLVEAVRQQADRSAVPARVEADDLTRLPAAVEVAAYRVVQEALTNVGKHAGATEVVVSLRLRGGELEVEVRDDGSGSLQPRPDGVGLGSMRERAEEIGGTFSVVAEPGSGTSVKVSLPLATGARRG